ENTMTKGKRIYVLDTNVLMHDPTALFKFEEHDVFIPMMVLEELDNGKKGHTEAARNARQVSRFLNELIEAHGSNNVEGGVALAPPSGLQLREDHPGVPVVLVSKDINLRIKASICNVAAEDYENDRAIDDFNLLFTGATELPADFWEKHEGNLRSWTEKG